MLQPIIEGETAHFFEEIKVGAMPLKNTPSTCNRELKYIIFVLDFCSHFQEEEEESDGLSTDLNEILKTAAQTQPVLSLVENSESDIEDGHEKLTRDLRLSSTRAASMYGQLSG